MKDDGGPAFPCGLISGMTLRDYFAGQALVGIALADAKQGGPYTCNENPELAFRAQQAYQLADAMLAERNKGKSE